MVNGTKGVMSVAWSVLDPRVKEGILTARDPRPTWAYMRKAMSRATAAPSAARTTTA